MANFDDLIKGLKTFNDGVQQYAITSAVNDAQEQLFEFNALEANRTKRLEEANRVANDLSLRLTGAGASPDQIRASVERMAPSLNMQYQYDAAREQEMLKQEGRMEVASLKADAKANQPEKLPKPRQLSDKSLKDLQGYEDALALVGDLVSRKPTTDTGPIASARNKLAQMVGIDDSEVTAFKVKVGKNLAEFIHRLSGAASSDKEAERLKQLQPKFEDSDETFAKKLQDLQQEITRQKSTYIQLRKKAGYDMSQFDESDSVVRSGDEDVRSMQVQRLEQFLASPAAQQNPGKAAAAKAALLKLKQAK